MVRFVSLLLAVALASALPAAAAGSPTPTDRDWRTWPFSETSPWNHPIGSGAQFTTVPGLSTFSASINYDDRWTSSIVIAQPSDPEIGISFGPGWGSNSQWAFLDGGGKTCGNVRSVELELLRYATLTLPFDGNYYSTLSTPDDSRWVLPTDYHKASQDYRSTFRFPYGACPSPDSDGLMAVFQPDGWVLDIFAAIVTSDHQVLGTMASYIDARGDGTGWWNGRRASMLPSFAGLIRTGEIASGTIPHALAVQVPSTLLKEQAVWPAYAFDRNAGYSGTLPMGALLAIPPAVDVTQLGLSPHGLAIARAAQNYGVYVVDRGGTGINVMAELANPEIRWQPSAAGPAWWQDISTIKNLLKRVSNNGPANIGGGGTPVAPFAPPFRVERPSPPRLLSNVPAN